MTQTEIAPETLAKKFAEILAGWMTLDQEKEILKRNKSEVNPSICHSHDFCDPNQAMIDALEAFGVELDIQSDQQTALIDEAWNIAKRNSFWFVCEF